MLNCYTLFTLLLLLLYIVMDQMIVYCESKMSDILQGSVATHIRCGGIFHDDFL